MPTTSTTTSTTRSTLRTRPPRPIPARPVPTGPAGRPALSAHEHRIAVLAAAGSSNRDIGDGLGVGARAVEHHLTSVYRKLSIGGRRQLRTALHAYARPGHRTGGL